MPSYEITLITRPMAKPELLNALRRTGKMLMDNGAVIEKVESLGYKDLPFKRIQKVTSEPVYTSNYFLMKTFMSREMKQTVSSILYNDLDLLHIAFVKEKPEQKIECNFEELLKPPSERPTVKALRDEQKLGHYTRQMIYKRTEKEWKSIPKSYPIMEPQP